MSMHMEHKSTTSPRHFGLKSSSFQIDRKGNWLFLAQSQNCSKKELEQFCSYFNKNRLYTIIEVLKTKFSPGSQNKFIWTPSTNGLFTTKSTHRMVSSQRTNLSYSPLAATNWKLLQKLKLNLNDRLKLFIWKIAWDIVPSKSRSNLVFSIPKLIQFVLYAMQRMIPFSPLFQLFFC